MSTRFSRDGIRAYARRWRARAPQERASGTRWEAADFDDKARIYYSEHHPGVAAPTIAEEDLVRVRERRAELFAQWDAVPPGGTLELAFDASRLR